LFSILPYFSKRQILQDSWRRS